MRLPVTLAIPKPLLMRRPAGRRVVSVTLRADGRLDVLHADGTETTCAVAAQTTVFPWLVVLLWRSEGKLESLVLPRFSLAAEDHRQLRLWLRWRAETA